MKFDFLSEVTKGDPDDSKDAKEFYKTYFKWALDEGFSRSNLQNMRSLYLVYPIYQSLTGKLSWTLCCEFLSIFDLDKRNFYEKEAGNSNWSLRE